MYISFSIILAGYESFYQFLSAQVGGYGLGIIALSLLTSIVLSPLLKLAGQATQREQEFQSVLDPQIQALKSEQDGKELHYEIKALYKRYGYHPIFAIRKISTLFAQLPFLILTYYMLSNMQALTGQSFLFIKDLGAQDALLGGFNLLPFVMTTINLCAALTMKNVSRSDLVQSTIFAVLFLFLLYQAEAGLLLYWSMNNLILFMKNLYDSNVPRKLSQSRPASSFNGLLRRAVVFNQKKLFVSIVVAAAIVFEVIVSSPSIIYLTNFDEFTFTYSEFLANIIPTVLVYLFVITIVFYVIPQKFNLFCTAVLTSLFFVSVFWLQTNIFVWNYGVLNGEAIHWNMFSSKLLIEFFCYLVLAAFFCFFRQQLFQKSVLFVSILCVTQLLTIVSSGFLSGYHNYNNKYSYSISAKNKYVFSKKQNVVVMILDTFDTSLFKEVLANNPNYKTELDGFVFFSNTMSSFPTTYASVPNILTSKVYKNSEPFNVFMEKAYYSDSSLFKRLKGKGFSTQTYSDLSVLLSPDLQENAVARRFSFDNRLFQSSIFRILPQYFKELFYANWWGIDFKSFLVVPINSHDFDSQKNIVAIYPKNVNGFYDSENLIPGYEFGQLVRGEDSKPTFKFFHYAGAHPINYKNALAKSRYDSAIHAMEIVSAMISSLKRNELYENTTLIILADHGPHSKDVKNINFNPILLVKPFNSRGTFKESSVPLMLGDVPKLVMNTFTTSRPSVDKLLKGIDIKDNRLRACYHYDWNDSWERSFLPPMTELYSIDGDIRSGVLNPSGVSYLDNYTKEIRSITDGSIIYFNDKRARKYASKAWSSSPEGLLITTQASSTAGEVDTLNSSPERLLFSDIKKKLSLSFYLPNWDKVNSLKMTISYMLPPGQGQGLLSVNKCFKRLVNSKNINDTSTIDFFLHKEALASCFGELYFRFYESPGLIIKKIDFSYITSELTLGRKLVFSAEEKSYFKYSTKGWSFQEQNHVWSVGKDAQLTFTLQDYDKKDLMLYYCGFPYLGNGKIRSQDVKVVINGQNVADWVMTKEDWYQARIPASLVGIDKKINVKLKISNPMSPKELGESPDSRKIGIGLRNVRIDYAKNI